MPQSWDSVTSITGKYGTTTLSQINSESINDGEPVSNAGPSAFSVLNNDSELDVAIKSAEIYNGKVKVVYTIPTLAGSHYSYVKLVYKVGTAPTNIYDGTAVDLDPTVTGTPQTVWISGLDLHQTYKFVIFTNKNKSQVATCTYTVVFPKITDISLIAVTRALIKCKIYPEVSESYINIKLIGKKGSVPANISDGTISIDLTVSTTEVEVSNLDENSLYYFEIFIVTDRRTINSYPADIRTGERVLPASTISSMTANYEKVTIRYSIPVLEDDDYDYIKVVFKADSEPTSASDGTVSALIPYQGEFTKQLSDLTTYYAAIFTRDIYGHEAKSNVMYVTTGQYVVPAATISNISVDQITVTMDCTVPSLPSDRSYHHVSLVGKIGSAPTSESDADVSINDIPLNTTSTQTFTNLDENTTYYFAIFSVDTQDHVTRSNVENITTGSLLITPSILELALGERATWDGSEVEIAWSGDGNSLTVQISNAHIVFKMYTGSTLIYTFTSPVGTSTTDIDKIHVGFLIDDENEVAKPSFIYDNGNDTYQYNQETPTDAEMSDIYEWISGRSNFVIFDSESEYKHPSFTDDSSKFIESGDGGTFSWRYRTKNNVLYFGNDNYWGGNYGFKWKQGIKKGYATKLYMECECDATGGYSYHVVDLYIAKDLNWGSNSTSSSWKTVTVISYASQTNYAGETPWTYMHKTLVEIPLDTVGVDDVFYIGFHKCDCGCMITKIYFDGQPTFV